LGWQWQCQLGYECHFLWAQCWFGHKRGWKWLKEVHVVIFIPCESQHFVQWQQKSHKLHHEFQYVYYYEHNIRSGYNRVNEMCAHTWMDKMGWKISCNWEMGYFKLHSKHCEKNWKSNLFHTLPFAKSMSQFLIQLDGWYVYNLQTFD
jgi:hypothetical protein